MNSLIGVFMLITANLMLVASFHNRTVFQNGTIFQNRTILQNGTIFHNKTIFRKSDIFDQVELPLLPTVNFTLPGTKWCGIGNSAANYDDLGKFNKTDMCCRAHQQCEEVIAPIGSLHSLENPSLLPKYSCKCEQKLLKCLKDLDDVPSSVIGQAYFSVMEKCFAKDYPAVECVEYQKGTMGMGKRCVLYKFDETKPQTYQYFDCPFYV